MITNDTELMAAQARLQVIQSMLAHARKTLTGPSFAAQAKGWLQEWERLEAEMRDHLSSPVAGEPRTPATIAGSRCAPGRPPTPRAPGRRSRSQCPA